MMKFCAFILLSATAALGADFVTGQAARLVIGQPTFTAQDPGASDTLIGAAGGVAYANNTLFVVDSNRIGATPTNNRLLIYGDLTTNLPQPTGTIQTVDYTRCTICSGHATVVLGQPDFTTTDINLTQTGMRLPTAVASDGRRIVVADTSNNRILIWNSIPTTNGAPADLELGQTGFTTAQAPPVVSNKSFRVPQGVWIQGDRLFVADTGNHRVLIWNHFPAQNDQPADVVLGQPNFDVAPEPDLTKTNLNAQANTLLNPVSVTSDGTHLFVADLGHNRVLIWNSIPATNQQAADVVLGQKDFETAIANDTSELCASNGVDTNNNPTYPALCGTTLSFPRFALSDGQRLFIADGGNDRVLIYNSIPTTNSVSADGVLGEPDLVSDVANDTNVGDTFNPNLNVLSPDQIRTPTALAWDGATLYVAEPYARRVLAFTPGENEVAANGVRNAASLYTYALGYITLSGTPTTNDDVKITIDSTNYEYKAVVNDTLTGVITSLVNLINAGSGDPNVLARGDVNFGLIQLRARVPGADGNNVTFSVTVTNTTSTTTTPGITATASSTQLSGAQNTAAMAPGTLVTIFGDNMAETEASADPNAQGLPRELGGVQVYFDLIPAPLTYVSPTQINAQIPYEVSDTTSINAYVLTHRASGDTISNAVAIPIVNQNPGVFAEPGDEPRAAIALHGSSYATATVSVDGTVNAGDVASILIQDREYDYTVQATDTLATIRDGLIAAINANPNEIVAASAAAAYTRVRLRAKIPGPDGNGISISTNISTNAQVILTALNSGTCCANVAGSPITPDNPAQAGETIFVYATGMGKVSPDAANNATVTGEVYNGPALNNANSSVSSLAGSTSANVISAGLKPGTIGIYEVVLELNSSMPTNPSTQLTISQDIYTSNVVTVPIVNASPNP